MAALAAVLLALSALPSRLHAQARLLGTLVSVEAEAGVLTIRSDQGEEATARFTESTRCLLVPPGEISLQKATPLDCAEIRTGDRVLARGRMATAGEPMEAELVVIMSRTALEEKRQAELEAWRTRGIYGRVVATDEVAGRLVIRSRTFRDTRDVTLEAAEGTQVWRYPTGKFRFADAVPSSIDKIHKGDQLQVLGERSEDGSQVRAEKIIAGSFRTFAATVAEIDLEGKRLKVHDLETGKTVTVRTDEAPALRRLPERMAMMLARVIEGGGPPGTQGGASGASPGGGRAGGGGFPGRREGGPALGFQQVLARAPEFALAELAVGEPLIISATDGSDDAPRIAITILAGVEPMLAAGSSDRGPVGGTWNFDINVVE